MNRRFRCGRLMLTKDGTIKKLELEDGGGSRFCDWDPIDIGFDDIHCRLLDIFNLGEIQYKTSLYDFERHPLDVKKYNSFLEYFRKHGLNCNSTIIYLCTHEAGHNSDSTMILMKEQKTSVITSNSSESNEKISPLVTLVDDHKNDSDKKQTNPFSSSNQLIINNLSPEVFSYAFERTSNDLVNNIRLLLNKNSFDEILIQLFQEICINHGYICSTINLLQQKIQQSNADFVLINQSEITFYIDNFNNIYNICYSVKKLIKQNKNKFNAIKQFQIIDNLFSEFNKNFKILYNKWFEYVERKNNNNNISITASSSSSFVHPIESIPSTSSNSNMQRSSEDHYGVNVKNSIEQSEISSISEPHHKKLTEKTVIFIQVLYHLDHLLTLLYEEHLIPYREIVRSTISKLKSLQSNIDLSNHESILDAKQAVLGMRYQYKTKFNEVPLKQTKYGISQELKDSFLKVRKAIDNLFSSLQRYQTQVNRYNQEKNSNDSSTSSITEKKQLENKRKLGDFRIDNNNRSSTASNSKIKRRKLFKK